MGLNAPAQLTLHCDPDELSRILHKITYPVLQASLAVCTKSCVAVATLLLMCRQVGLRRARIYLCYTEARVAQTQTQIHRRRYSFLAPSNTCPSFDITKVCDQFQTAAWLGNWKNNYKILKIQYYMSDSCQTNSEHDKISVVGQKVKTIAWIEKKDLLPIGQLWWNVALLHILVTASSRADPLSPELCSSVRASLPPAAGWILLTGELWSRCMQGLLANHP